MTNGFGTQASFNRPQGIYFNSISKNLVIADNGNYAIRIMNQTGEFLSFRTFFFSLLIPKIQNMRKAKNKKPLTKKNKKPPHKKKIK